MRHKKRRKEQAIRVSTNATSIGYTMLNHQSSAILKTAPRRRSLSSITPENCKSSFLHKIWAENHSSDKLFGASENQSSGIINSPTPAALAENPLPNSAPLHHEGQTITPRRPRKHQRSLTALLPLRSSRGSFISPQRPPQRLPQRSPVEENLEFDFTPTLTGDKDGKIKIANRSKGGLSGWFNGISIPIPVGLPVDEVERTVLPPPSVPPRFQSSDHTEAKLRKKPIMSRNDNTTSTKPAAASRFAFFTPKRPTTKTFQIPSTLDDEYLSLNITAALFPGGPPKECDPFSPCAIQTLLANAEGLLLRLQTAYKLRTVSLYDLAAEHEAQKDELEGAETRAKHLRMQLEDMAQRAAVHDEEMMKVINELIAVKQARATEQEAREKSINLIRSRTIPLCEGRSSWSADSGVGKRHHHAWQSSNEANYSDTSLESDEESSSHESVFSRSTSPVTSEASGSCSRTPEVHEAVAAKVVTGARPPVRPKSVQQKSTFQKILSQMTTSGEDTMEGAGLEETEEDNELGMAEQRCRNCRGGSTSTAWDTVGLLRAENRNLKERVNRLESAVEGALDLVGGFGV
jgi:hypothetical protein